MSFASFFCVQPFFSVNGVIFATPLMPTPQDKQRRRAISKHHRDLRFTTRHVCKIVEKIAGERLPMDISLHEAGFNSRDLTMLEADLRLFFGVKRLSLRWSSWALGLTVNDIINRVTAEAAEDESNGSDDDDADGDDDSDDNGCAASDGVAGGMHSDDSDDNNEGDEVHGSGHDDGQGSMGACIFTLAGHSGGISVLVTVTDERIVSGSYDGTLRVWDVKKGICVGVLQADVRVYALARLSARQVVSGGADRVLKVWNVEERKVHRTLAGHDMWVNDISVFDENRVVSASHDGTLKLWDVDSGRCLQTIHHDCPVSAVAGLHGGSQVVSGTEEGAVTVWNVMTGVCIKRWPGPDAWPCEVSCISVIDRNRIITTDGAGDLKVFCVQSQKLIVSLPGNIGMLSGVAPLSSQQVVFGGHQYSNVRLMDIEEGKCKGFLHGHSAPVRALAVLRGDRVVSGSYDCTLKIWDLEQKTPKREGMPLWRVPLLIRIWDDAEEVYVGSDSSEVVHQMTITPLIHTAPQTEKPCKYYAFLHPTSLTVLYNKLVHNSDVVIEVVRAPKSHPCLGQYGLFAAAQGFAKGDTVGFYTGVVHTDTMADEGSSYLAELPTSSQSLCVDSAHRGNETKFINDIKGSQAPPNVVLPTEPEYDTLGLPVIRITATRTIAANEEIRMEYGDQYWTAWNDLMCSGTLQRVPKRRKLSPPAEFLTAADFTSVLVWEWISSRLLRAIAKPQAMAKVEVKGFKEPGSPIHYVACARQSIKCGEELGKLAGRILQPNEPSGPKAVVYYPSGTKIKRIEAENEARFFMDAPCPNCHFVMRWTMQGAMYFAIESLRDIGKHDMLSMHRMG